MYNLARGFGLSYDEHHLPVLIAEHITIIDTFTSRVAKARLPTPGLGRGHAGNLLSDPVTVSP